MGRSGPVLGVFVFPVKVKPARCTATRVCRKMSQVVVRRSVNMFNMFLLLASTNATKTLVHAYNLHVAENTNKGLLMNTW